jgi:ribosomal protein L37E
MFDKYDALLKKRHPELFSSPQCSNGWFELIDKLMLDIEKELAALGVPRNEWPQSIQIKEKFGTLRYYTSMPNVDGASDIQSTIGKAEDKSATTCERCGEPGHTFFTGWAHTYCTSCEEWYAQLKRSKSESDVEVEVPYAEELLTH